MQKENISENDLIGYTCQCKKEWLGDKCEKSIM
jgi:hypothetical protein